MTTRAIVLDANILIRAVLGVKVSALIADHAAGVNFLAPDTAFQEVQEHLPAILSARGAAAEDLAKALRALDALASVVTAVPAQSYDPSRVAALARIGGARSPRLVGTGVCAAVGLSDLDRRP